MRSRPSVLFAILLLALTSCASPPAAVPTPTPTEATAAPRLEAQGKRVAIFEPTDFAGVYRDIATIGQIVGRESAAADLVRRMRDRIGAVTERARTATAQVRVLHEIDASDPTKIYVAGP